MHTGDHDSNGNGDQQADVLRDLESTTLRAKDLHHLKLPPVPESAAQFRTWRNMVRTAILAFDASAEGHLWPWLSRAFTARGQEGVELSRDSGEFPKV